MSIVPRELLVRPLLSMCATGEQAYCLFDMTFYKPLSKELFQRRNHDKAFEFADNDPQRGSASMHQRPENNPEIRINNYSNNPNKFLPNTSH